MIQNDNVIPDYAFRIIIVGDSSSGKSSFLSRFCSDAFDEKSGNTVGIDFKTRLVKLNDDKIAKFQIWDTAGQENFYSICKNYYYHTSAALLFYDISNRESFNNIELWIRRLRENNKNFNQGENGIIFIVGNKNDLEHKRTVSFEEGLSISIKYKTLFSEMSCKTGKNAHTVGETLANKIYTGIKDGSISLTDISSGAKLINTNDYIRLNSTQKKAKCCW